MSLKSMLNTEGQLTKTKITNFFVAVVLKFKIIWRFYSRLSDMANICSMINFLKIKKIS